MLEGISRSISWQVGKMEIQLELIQTIVQYINALDHKMDVLSQKLLPARQETTPMCKLCDALTNKLSQLPDIMQALLNEVKAGPGAPKAGALKVRQEMIVSRKDVVLDKDISPPSFSPTMAHVMETTELTPPDQSSKSDVLCINDNCQVTKREDQAAGPKAKNKKATSRSEKKRQKRSRQKKCVSHCC